MDLEPPGGSFERDPPSIHKTIFHHISPDVDKLLSSCNLQQSTTVPYACSIVELIHAALNFSSESTRCCIQFLVITIFFMMTVLKTGTLK